MKIAVVRGPSLNPWEMQNYLPLARRHELRLIGRSIRHPDPDRSVGRRISSRILFMRGILRLRQAQAQNDDKDKNPEIVERVCLGEVFNFIPGGINFLYRFLGDPQMILGLERAIAGFDIVHPAELANYYSFQAVKARQRGLVKRVVVTCWENIAGVRETHPAQKRIKKAVIKGADHFLAVTEGAKKALLAEGVKEERVTVVGMGVNLKRCKGAKVQRFKVKKGKRILFVGRLEEEKGIWELLKAFGDLRCKGAKVQRCKDLKLTMVGRGSQEKRIRDWRISNQLERAVQLKGWVEYEKIWQEYRRADIFVLPSKSSLTRSKPSQTWQEQFGMVLVEAMASGLPIVATQSGAIPEVVGPAGILVEPDDVKGLAEAMTRLLGDVRLGKELRERGLKRARERYDSEKVARRIEEVYRKVISD